MPAAPIGLGKIKEAHLSAMVSPVDRHIDVPHH